MTPWCGKDDPVVAGVPAKPRPKTPVPKAATGGCKGLAKAPCQGSTGCRWVAHATPADKNGRPLTDYCRVAGRG